MREVDGNSKPTEAVNVVVQNRKGYTKHKYRSQRELAHSHESFGEFHDFGRNYVLYMAKGAVSVADKIFMPKKCQKKSRVRGM